ncbi:hypothetical protein M3I54_08290 [Paraburkholderia sp. CNPSo 3274]|uniref:hypothetical protein n=1 Tax=Paraburkholderia sp. CNPSo 3274 TaxID=2940932 RepID=UPI0020B837D9|nr:hypothetical protein [Paraburkholderia sp. CNPSo 3274]MCP3706984.1 hypothetical protein [Paraburkholderia sp. CNPSo 3274]
MIDTRKRGEEMRASRNLAISQLTVLLLLLLAYGMASAAGDRAAPAASPRFEPSELSTDCIDREYRGKNARLGLDYTDLINNCGASVIITWQSFNNGAPQTEGGGMGQSECIPPGGSITTASRQRLGTESENLPVSVVTCQ